MDAILGTGRQTPGEACGERALGEIPPIRVHPQGAVTRQQGPIGLKAAQVDSKHLLDVADPYLELIHQYLGERPHVVALVNGDGLVMHFLAEEVSLCEGDIGSNRNGISTSVHGKPTLITGPDCFVLGCASWISSSIPIKAPDGQALGALDVSVPNVSVDPRIWGLALLTVQQIEGQLADTGEAPITHDELLAEIDNPLRIAAGILTLLICQPGLSPTHKAIVYRAQKELSSGQADLQQLAGQVVALQSEIQSARAISEHRGIGLEAMFEAIPDVAVFVDSAGRILEANVNGIAMLGASGRDELPADLDALLTSCEASYQDGMPVEASDLLEGCTNKADPVCHFTDLKGREIDLLLLIRPIAALGRATDRILLLGRDVTELKHLERAKDELLEVVSHELRNPLQVIKGLLQLLRVKLRNLAKHEIEQRLDLLDKQVNRLTYLVNDILTAYRASNPRFRMDFRPTDLTALLEEALYPFIMNDSGHQVIVEMPKQVSVTVNRDGIMQVLNSLISNALEYTPPGKRIWVTVQLEDRSVLTMVADEGVGIDPERMESIFDGFSRGGRLADWRTGSIGLGLYVSRSIARRHGGDLWAEARSGGGTIMCFRLPLAQSPTEGCSRLKVELS